MRDCLIVGSGRSGTSMVASMFAAAGYFMGDNLIPPRKGNERGFFESEDVIDINEDLLDQVVPTRPTDFVRSRLYRWRPTRAQRWAAAPASAKSPFTISSNIVRRMQAQLQSPFCLKDPRFCSTLPAWRPMTQQPLYLCVFRHPVETIRSIIKYGTGLGLGGYPIDWDGLVDMWSRAYSNVFAWADNDDSEDNEWVFVEYEDVLTDPGIVTFLGTLVGAPLDSKIADETMRSVTRGRQPVPDLCAPTYDELQRRSRMTLRRPEADGELHPMAKSVAERVRLDLDRRHVGSQPPAPPIQPVGRPLGIEARPAGGPHHVWNHPARVDDIPDDRFARRAFLEKWAAEQQGRESASVAARGRETILRRADDRLTGERRGAAAIVRLAARDVHHRGRRMWERCRAAAVVRMTVRRVHGPRRIEYGPDEVVAISVVHNGELHVRSFCDHYFALGVKHIVLMLNNSTDRTGAIAATYPNVTILRCDLPYERYGNLMKRFLARRFSDGRWALCVEIDELFDYPCASLAVASRHGN